MALPKIKSIFYKLLIFFIFLIIINFIVAPQLFAQANPNNPVLNALKNSGGSAGYSIPAGKTASSFLDTIIGQIIAVILGFVGVLFLIMIIYSGFQWMTAGGNEETVTKAKKRLTEAAIGIGIIFAAWIISYFIFTQLGNVTQSIT